MARPRRHEPAPENAAPEIVPPEKAPPSEGAGLGVLPGAEGRQSRVLRRGRQAEAARNDKLVLEAARDVFGAEGCRAPVAAIAERAGVGMGSLYRRYGSKDELLQRLCVLAMEQAIAAAREGLAEADPWEGLAGYVRECVRFGSGVFASAAGTIPLTAEMLDTAGRAQCLQNELMRRAQEARALRDDVTALDIALLIQHFSPRPRPGPDHDERENARWRLLELALDGLRTPRPSPLPGRPPSRQWYEGRWGRGPAPG